MFHKKLHRKNVIQIIVLNGKSLHLLIDRNSSGGLEFISKNYGSINLVYDTVWCSVGEKQIIETILLSKLSILKY